MWAVHHSFLHDSELALLLSLLGCLAPGKGANLCKLVLDVC